MHLDNEKWYNAHVSLLQYSYSTNPLPSSSENIIIPYGHVQLYVHTGVRTRVPRAGSDFIPLSAIPYNSALRVHTAQAPTGTLSCTPGVTSVNFPSTTV